MEEIPNCNYYGRLHGPLLGDNIGVYCVDEAFSRLLDKYEERLKESQNRLIVTLKKSFSDEIKSFKESVIDLKIRISKLEVMIVTKDKKEKRDDKNQKPSTIY